MEQTFVSDRSSGRNVMIACVTDEVAMITKPATFYHIDRVHLLNYVTPEEYQDSESRKARATMYKAVYDEVCKRMESLGITVMPSLGNIPTYRFDHMLEAVYRIIKMESEKDEDTIRENLGRLETCINSLKSLIEDGEEDKPTEDEEKSEEAQPEVNPAGEEPKSEGNSKRAEALLEKINSIKGGS